jgi:hypothetical protein
MADPFPFPRRRYPCNECPWKRDAPVGQFPASRYEALRATSDQSGMGAPFFGCHKGEPGTGTDLACAGWLAVAGSEHLGIRLAVIMGRLDPGDLRPGDGWPDLYGSYEELAAANGASDA